MKILQLIYVLKTKVLGRIIRGNKCINGKRGCCVLILIQRSSNRTVSFKRNLQTEEVLCVCVFSVKVQFIFCVEYNVLLDAIIFYSFSTYLELVH